MLLDNPYPLPQREPLIGPLPHRFIEGGLCKVDVPDGGDGPPYVQGVLVPQLHAVIEIGDVVEVRVRDLPKQASTSRYRSE